ncbi:hypothetical protein [Nonomuraea sp. SBT364]|uniref:hypothetical protein n=1 Tax=Nonomuraea sp. SBT364 TaxID=1580530 RepID=UPI00066CFAD5|nr:hypothetical protein [Nonomuraea sp. SBT364]
MDDEFAEYVTHRQQRLCRTAYLLTREHFTPTGSSWINQAERWCGYLTDQLSRRGVHKNVQALEHRFSRDRRGVIPTRSTAATA